MAQKSSVRHRLYFTLKALFLATCILQSLNSNAILCEHLANGSFKSQPTLGAYADRYLSLIRQSAPDSKALDQLLDQRPIRFIPELADAISTHPSEKDNLEGVAKALLELYSPAEAQKEFKRFLEGYELQNRILDSHQKVKDQHEATVAFIQEIWGSGHFEGLQKYGAKGSWQHNKDFILKLLTSFREVDSLSKEASPETRGAAAAPDTFANLLGLEMNESREQALRSMTNALLILSASTEDSGAYESFKAGQKIKPLSQDSFLQLSKQMHEVVKSSDDLHALFVSLMINDIAKSEDLKKAAGISSFIADHDKVTKIILDMGLVQGFGLLPVPAQEKIRAAIGGELNLAQMRQGENTPDSIKNARKMSREAFLWFWAMDVCHVSAFAAKFNPKGAPFWNEDLFGRDQRLKTQLLDYVDRGDLSADEVYDNFLRGEATLLGIFYPSHGPQAKYTDREQYAKAATRIALMSLHYTIEEASIDLNVLEKHERGKQLATFLADHKILIYYAPNLFRGSAKLFKVDQKINQEEKSISLSASLDFAYKVMHHIYTSDYFYAFTRGDPTKSPDLRNSVVNIGNLTATIASLKNPDDLANNYVIELAPTGDGKEVAVVSPRIDFSASEGGPQVLKSSSLSPIQQHELRKLAQAVYKHTVAYSDEHFRQNSGFTEREWVALFMYQNTLVARVLNGLLRQQRQGVLDSQSRELVTDIDRALALIETYAIQFPEKKDKILYTGKVTRFGSFPREFIQNTFLPGAVLNLGGITYPDAGFVSLATNPPNIPNWVLSTSVKMTISIRNVPRIMNFGLHVDSDMQGSIEKAFGEDPFYFRSCLGECVPPRNLRFRVDTFKWNTDSVAEVDLQQFDPYN